MSANRAAVALIAWALLTVESRAAEPPDPKAVAQRVDELMAKQWKKNNLVPAAVADDAEFHRRAHLDLAGRIPTVDEVRAFLLDNEKDKREKLVEQLSGGSFHPTHFARLWRAALIPHGTTITPQEIAPFEAWLRERIAENMRYDEFARGLITADLRNTTTPAVTYARALERDAGNAASSTARVFLGLRLECARCHNHPFAPWTRDQFWQLAAVFEDVEEVPFRVAWAPRIRIPDTNRTVLATLPDGTAVKEAPGTPRDQLSRWLAKSDNPFFARAAVNRVWAILCGTPLADQPEDGEDAPMHAAAAEELSRAFVRSGFDTRFLIRAITATRAYQFTSARSHASQDDPKAFARMALKPLSADQLADTLAVVFGADDPTTRAAVIERFAGADGDVTILQALWWMNGGVVGRATTATSRALAPIADNDKLDTRAKVEGLFLLTLNRKPTKAEADRFAKYIDADEKNRGRALADVFWVLLNSTEFAVNR